MGLENGNSFKERIKSLSLEEKIQKEIFDTGASISSKDGFKKRASISSNVIKKENIPNLINYLINPMEKVSDFKSRFNEINEYVSVVEDTIFEIMYNFRETSVPYLKDLVLKSSMPIRVKAMNILCRLAEASIEKDRIVKFIDENIDDLRYEVIIPSVYFITFIKNSPEILSIFERFFYLYNDDYEEYADGLYILENIYRYDRNAITPYIPFLKEYALYKNFRNRPNLDSVFIRNLIGDDRDDMNFCFNNSSGEIGNIKSALFYSKIIPDDDEIYNKLSKWYYSVKDNDLRNKIEVALRKYSSIKGA